MKRTIQTDDAPDAVGPYSQATTNGDLLFTAGQVALTPDGDAMNDAPVEEQARQALDNVAAILDAEGLTMDDVLKTTVYLDDMDDYDAVNEVYAEYFEGDPPARSAVGVDELPVGFDVEVEVIADAS